MGRPSCPKCGTAVSARAVICPACDFIVDTSFLEDFTTEVSLQALKPAAPGARPKMASEEIASDEIDASESGSGEAAEPTAISDVRFPHVEAGALIDDEAADGFDDGEGMRTVPSLRVNRATLSGATAVNRRPTNPRISPDDDQIDTAPHRQPAARAPAARATDDRRGAAGAGAGGGTPAAPRPYGGEALILGDPASLVADFDSMLSDQTSSYTVGKDLARVFEPAPVYVAPSLKQMIEPSAVLALKHGAQPDSLQLSMFERTVIRLIDGQRPVARIAKKGAIPLDDLKIAIGMLADRQLLVFKGRVRRKVATDPSVAVEVGDDLIVDVNDADTSADPGFADIDLADFDGVDADGSGDVFVIDSDDAVDDDELRLQHAVDPFAHEPGSEAPAVMDMPLGVGPLDLPPTTEPSPGGAAATTDATREAPSPITLASRPPATTTRPRIPAPVTTAGDAVAAAPQIFARARPVPMSLPDARVETPRPDARPLPAPIAAPAPAPISSPAPVTVETRVPAALRVPSLPDALRAPAPAPFAMPRATPAPVAVDRVADVVASVVDIPDIASDTSGEFIDVTSSESAALPRDMQAIVDVERPLAVPLDAQLDSPSSTALPLAVGTLVENRAPAAPASSASSASSASPASSASSASSVSSPVSPASPASFRAELAVESALSDEVAVRPAATLRPAMPTRAATNVIVVSAPAPTTPGGGTASLPAQAQAQAHAHAQAQASAKAAQLVDNALADLRAGRQSRALAYAKMAAKADPTNTRAQELLASWNNPTKLAALATSDVAANAGGLVAEPVQADQQLVLEAQHAEEARDFAKAADLYKKAIAIKPDEPELRNRLGILLALRLRDYTAATSELMRACELAPENLAYRSNLGKIFKLANGAPSDATMHTGPDDEKLRDAEKKPTLFDRLRGKR